MIQQPGRLSPTLWSLLRDPSNQRLLSLASCWEIAIKYGNGKLALPRPWVQFIPEGLSATATDVLPISLDHIQRVATLPQHHRDPFDRLLIAQAIGEQIPVVTTDVRFTRYPVRLIPA